MVKYIKHCPNVISINYVQGPGFSAFINTEDNNRDDDIDSSHSQISDPLCIDDNEYRDYEWEYIDYSYSCKDAWNNFNNKKSNSRRNVELPELRKIDIDTVSYDTLFRVFAKYLKQVESFELIGDRD